MPPFRPSLPRPPDRRLGAALVALGALGIGWRVDSWARERRTARLHRATVDLLLNVLQADDALTNRHSRRVADLADALAAPLRRGRAERATLRLAALLHDMGKVDDRFFHIVHSREPLSARQRAEIEHHPHQSAHILRPLEAIHPGIMRIVASHHECWNGSGYPAGAAQEEIPLAARIIALADVFDALTQPRAYREPWKMDRALEELQGGAGSRFDPDLVDVLLNHPNVRERWARIARRGRAEEREAEDPQAA